jgi:Uncharacterized conserved protein (DUF2190)
MSFEVVGLPLPGQLALSDLSAKQFFFIKVSTTAGNVDLNTTSGGPCIGVLQNKPTAGLEAEVNTAGVSKVVAGAAVTMGDLIMSDGAGKAITYVAGGSNACLGQALEAAGGAGTIIAVVLKSGLGKGA